MQLDRVQTVTAFVVATIALGGLTGLVIHKAMKANGEGDDDDLSSSNIFSESPASVSKLAPIPDVLDMEVIQNEIVKIDGKEAEKISSSKIDQEEEMVTKLKASLLFCNGQEAKVENVIEAPTQPLSKPQIPQQVAPASNLPICINNLTFVKASNGERKEKKTSALVGDDVQGQIKNSTDSNSQAKNDPEVATREQKMQSAKELSMKTFIGAKASEKKGLKYKDSLSLLSPKESAKETEQKVQVSIEDVLKKRQGEREERLSKQQRKINDTEKAKENEEEESVKFDFSFLNRKLSDSKNEDSETEGDESEDPEKDSSDDDSEDRSSDSGDDEKDNIDDFINKLFKEEDDE